MTLVYGSSGTLVALGGLSTEISAEQAIWESACHPAAACLKDLGLTDTLPLLNGEHRR